MLENLDKRPCSGSLFNVLNQVRSMPMSFVNKYQNERQKTKGKDTGFADCTKKENFTELGRRSCPQKVAHTYSIQ